MEKVSGDAHTSFDVLGHLRVHLDGEPVDVAGHRLRTLLALLLLDPGRNIGLGTLAEGIWGDHPPAQVGNALQALVSRLRSVLGAGLIVAGTAGYRLAVEPTQVDAYRFARLAAKGGKALDARAPGPASETLRAALALWRGPAFADLAGNPVATAEITRLESLRLDAEEDRLEADLKLGRHEEAAAELPSLIAAQPLRERLRGQYMRALYGAGRQVEALAAFEAAREAFASLLGTDPSPELAATHLAMLRREWAEHPVTPAAPPPAPAARRRGNLRARLTSFVGREPDVAEVGALLAERRLVTLLGPGGAGKTRLAVEAAEALFSDLPGRHDDAGASPVGMRGEPRLFTPGEPADGRRSLHTGEMPSGTHPGIRDEPTGSRRDGSWSDGSGGLPDGVWLVELAPLRDPQEVPQAILTALGVRDPMGTAGRPAAPSGEPLDASARLVNVIARRELLLVLDNCEHLVETAAVLAERLLAECPGVRVLATSREPLGITGETLWTVGPLGLPPDDAGDDALAYPAVKLFADRAAAVRPGYRVPEEASAVVRICRELDGMPLAIELAAARLRSLSAGQIADRLHDRFRLLTGGSRTALPRHQTLRAVVSWSWDLLDEHERTLAARLAVFSGGGTLDAAEQVCAGGGLDQRDVLGVLARLVDKSLVTADSGRYHMLETVRAYAGEHLAESGEEDAVRLAHAQFCTDLAESAAPGLRGPDQLQWIAELSAEHDNTSAALRWATDTGHADLALRLVGALGWFWWLVGKRAEGAYRAREVLRMAGDADPVLLATAHVSFGINAGGAAVLWAEAHASLETAIKMIRDHCTPPLSPLLAMAHPTQAALSGRWAHDEQELAAGLISHPDPWVTAVGHMLRGHMHFSSGRIAQGEADLKEALARFRAVGDRWGAGNSLATLSELGFLDGRTVESIVSMREAITHIEEIGAVEDTPYMRCRLAVGLRLSGDREAADQVLRDAEELVIRCGDVIGESEVRLVQGDFAREDGDLEAARRHYHAAMARMEGREALPEQVRSLVNSSLAMLAEAEGDLEQARRRHMHSLGIAEQSQDTVMLSMAVVGCAALALADGDAPLAATLLGGAAAIRGIDQVIDFDHVRITETAKAALGPGEYSRFAERGRMMRPDEVVLLAGDLRRGPDPGPEPPGRDLRRDGES